MQSSYIVQTLRDNHVKLNVGDRKKPLTVHGLLIAISSKIKSAFTRASGSPSVATEGESAGSTINEDGERRSERNNNVGGEGEPAPLKSASYFSVLNPFTPAKKRGRGRKRKSLTPNDTAITKTPSNICASSAAKPTPSPDTAYNNIVITKYASDITSSNLGARRVTPDDILNIKRDDEVSLVIPVDRKHEGRDIKAKRSHIKRRLNYHPELYPGQCLLRCGGRIHHYHHRVETTANVRHPGPVGTYEMYG